jgi:hypothetical protein
MDALVDLITHNGNTRAVLGLTTSEFEQQWYRFVEGQYLSG